MKNIKQIAIIVVLVIAGVPCLSQPGSSYGKKREEVESMKVAFITRKLELTPTEAQAFWPVYNQYQESLQKLRENRKNETRNIRQHPDSVSEKEVEKLIDGEIAFRQAEVDLMKQYHAQFKKVLPVKKVARLYHSEDEFKRELLRRIKDHDGERRRSR